MRSTLLKRVLFYFGGSRKSVTGDVLILNMSLVNEQWGLKIPVRSELKINTLFNRYERTNGNLVKVL
jgi:hypothetical protein